MTPFSMAIAAATLLGEGGTHINLIPPKRGRLPKGFPRGEFLSETEHGKIYAFDAMKVLLWLITTQVVSVSVEDGAIVIKAPDESDTPTS